MSGLERLVRVVAFGYLAVVSAVAVLLVVVGSLLRRLPGRPTAVERAYAAFAVWLLDGALRPFDALPPVEGR